MLLMMEGIPPITAGALKRRPVSLYRGEEGQSDDCSVLPRTRGLSARQSSAGFAIVRNRRFSNTRFRILVPRWQFSCHEVSG